MITAVVAVALLVVGAILALPIEPALSLLEPIESFVAGYGLTLDTEMGYLFLFAGNVLLIVGSLVPGI
jgi:hypothetical protein